MTELQFASRKKVGQSRAKMTMVGQIEAIEKEIRETPYHKGTERHIGLLRARLAKLRDQEVEKGSKKGGGGQGYAVKKQGDATIVLVGPPSVGKSTLLNKLTNAKSKVAPYAFTTVSVIPGMMNYKNAYIQILDVPGLIRGAEEGKGRGREVLSVVRGADLLVIMTDHKNLYAHTKIPEALERNGIRINKAAPDITIDKKLSGGIIIHSNITQDLDKETIKEVAGQFNIKNAEITIRERLTLESLIDAFAKNRVYIRAILVVNKADLIRSGQKFDRNVIRISADKDLGLDELKNTIWEELDLKTIYLVRVDEEPNKNNPMVVRGQIDLLQVMKNLGSEFAENKKRAKIWESGAKFPGQEVSLKTNVVDGMMIRFE